MKIKPLTVSQVVQTLKQTINQNELLRNVALVGELSNFVPHRSGHFYFTMKDETSRIDCVMFSGEKKVVFKPKDGDKVIITGYCDIYIPGGRIQFYAQKMNLDGLGDLHIRFEELKKELFKEGYFNEDLKKPIEKYPEFIAVISAKNSAAHADITKTLKQRWPLAQQMNYFAYVQGDNAVPSLIEQIKKANQEDLADTILLSRGGGSIEDLWSFNDPDLIKTIVASKIPIICGVGHESDNTLAELAADLRAATPTAAAVAATPDQTDVKKQLRDYMNRFYISVRRKNEKDIHNYRSVIEASYLNNPERFFGNQQQRLDEINLKFNGVMNRFQTINRKIASQESEMVHKFRRILEMQESKINRIEVSMNHQIKDLIKNKHYQFKSLVMKPDKFYNDFKNTQTKIDNNKKEIIRYMQGHLRDEKQNYLNLIDKLHHLSPLEIMKRGFSLAYVDDVLIRSIDQVNLEDELIIRLQDGIIETRVYKKEGIEE